MAAVNKNTDLTGPSCSDSSVSKLEFSDPLFLHPTDTSSTPIISFKLSGTENYKVWSCAMTLALQTKNKVGFVNGNCKKPETDVSLQEQWERCNSVVLSWILSSVSEELYLGQIFSNNAKIVWDELKETYDKVDGSVTFNLHHRINSLTQSGLSLSEYYHKLNSLWRQFDSLVNLPVCTCESSIRLKEHNQLIKLMQFLMGLDEVYAPVRSNILTSDPIPDVKTAFSILSRDESHRNSHVSGVTNKSTSTAFVTKPNEWTNKNNQNNKRFNRNTNLVCKYCNMNGHTIDRCYEIVGYPPGFKKKTSNNAGTSNQSSVSVKSDQCAGSSFPFTSDQVQKLMSLISNKPETSELQSCAAGKTVMSNHVFSFLKCRFFNFNTDISTYSTYVGLIIDSGASQHMTHNAKMLFDVINVSHLNLTVAHPNGTVAQVNQVGNFKLTEKLILKDVLVVPGYHVSLISVHKLSKDNKVKVIFDESKCLIQDSTQEFLLGTGSERGGLYYFDSEKRLVNNNIVSCVLSKCIWHNRLGHPSDQVLGILKTKLNIENIASIEPCEVCHKAKQTRESFPLSEHKSSNLGDLVHLDVWGPYKVSSREGYKYFLTVVDDYTRAVWLFLLKGKHEVLDHVEMFYKLLKTQFDKSVKVFRSDNGTEFINKSFESFTVSNGIIHQTSCVYTPQQNGIVERKHRHLLNVARSLMFQGGLPLNMWSECVLTSTYLINRLPTAVLNGKSPYELIYNTQPNLSHLKSFGCLCFATILNNKDKFSSRSEKCVFVGYSFNKKGYKLYSLDNKCMIFSRDVKFYETVYPFKNESLTTDYVFKQNEIDCINFFDEIHIPKENSADEPNDEERENTNSGGTIGSLETADTSTSSKDLSYTQHLDITQSLDESQVLGSSDKVSQNSESAALNDVYDLSEGEDKNNSDSLVLSNVNSEVSTTIRKSNRPSKLRAKLGEYELDGKVKYGIDRVVNYSVLTPENYVFSTNLNKIVEPKTFAEASVDNRWIEAMNQEMEALNRNGTWKITELPSNRKPIGCKWVYKVKYKSNGEVERFKARLVAKGYNQKEGIDYEETFSPVVKIVTVRCLLSVAVQNKWPIYQLDINNAFLYGELVEDVYMTLPDGYFSKSDNRVCKLLKSLYGLKQAPRKWNEKLTQVLLENGFEQSKSDYSLFTKSKNDLFLVVLVYVDDILVTGNNEVEINKFKGFLSSKFLIKDLEKLKYFLGIEVLENGHGGLCLNQRKYCLELLSEFGMLACKPENTPLGGQLSWMVSKGNCKSDKPLVGINNYQKLVGKLIYLTLTRPDISYAVHCLSQFMHAPLESHLKLAFKVLRYLKGSPGTGISFNPSESLCLKAFADSDWAKCRMTRRSVTGYTVFLGSNLVSWKSKKQSVVARSSAEAEYRAMCTVTCEVIWVLKILDELKVNIELPISVNCDNSSALQIAANPVFHEQTKHFGIDLYFLREKVAAGLIKTVKIKSEENVADLFTKGLSTKIHKGFCDELGLINLYSK